MSSSQLSLDHPEGPSGQAQDIHTGFNGLFEGEENVYHVVVEDRQRLEASAPESTTMRDGDLDIDNSTGATHPWSVSDGYIGARTWNISSMTSSLPADLVNNNDEDQQYVGKVPRTALEDASGMQEVMEEMQEVCEQVPTADGLLLPVNTPTATARSAKNPQLQDQWHTHASLRAIRRTAPQPNSYGTRKSSASIDLLPGLQSPTPGVNLPQRHTIPRQLKVVTAKPQQSSLHQQLLRCEESDFSVSTCTSDVFNTSSNQPAVTKTDLQQKGDSIMDTSRHMNSLPVKSTVNNQQSTTAQNQYWTEPTRQSTSEITSSVHYRASTPSAILLPTETPTGVEMSTINARRHLEQLESEARRLKAQLNRLQCKDHVDRHESTDVDLFPASESHLLESPPTQGQELPLKLQPHVARHHSTTPRLHPPQGDGPHRSYVITGPTYGPDLPNVMMSPFATTADQQRLNHQRVTVQFPVKHHSQSNGSDSLASQRSVEMLSSPSHSSMSGDSTPPYVRTVTATRTASADQRYEGAGDAQHSSSVYHRSDMNIDSDQLPSDRYGELEREVHRQKQILGDTAALVQQMYDTFTTYMERNVAESLPPTSSVRGRRVVTSADIHREQEATDSDQQDQPSGRFQSVVIKPSKRQHNKDNSPTRQRRQRQSSREDVDREDHHRVEKTSGRGKKTAPDKGNGKHSSSENDSSDEDDRRLPDRGRSPHRSSARGHRKDSSEDDESLVSSRRRHHHRRSAGRQRVHRIKVDSFDGNYPVEVFLAQFEDIAKYNNWTKKDMAAHIKAALKGGARNLLWESTGATNDEVVDKLRRRYGSSELQEKFRVELKSRKRKDDESLCDDTSRHRRLVKLVMLSVFSPSPSVASLSY